MKAHEAPSNESGHGGWLEVGILSGIVLYVTSTKLMHNVPLTLNKSVFHRTIIEIFKQAQHEASDILPHAWIH